MIRKHKQISHTNNNDSKSPLNYLLMINMSASRLNDGVKSAWDSDH